MIEGVQDNHNSSNNNHSSYLSSPDSFFHTSPVPPQDHQDRRDPPADDQPPAVPFDGDLVSEPDELDIALSKAAREGGFGSHRLAGISRQDPPNESPPNPPVEPSPVQQSQDVQDEAPQERQLIAVDGDLHQHRAALREDYESLTQSDREILKDHVQKLEATAKPEILKDVWSEKLNLSEFIKKTLMEGIQAPKNDPALFTVTREARLETNLPGDWMQEYNLKKHEKLATKITVDHYARLGIISEVPHESIEGFGHLFTRDKDDGSFRIIYDMRPVNVDAPAPEFMMPSPF